MHERNVKLAILGESPVAAYCTCLDDGYYLELKVLYLDVVRSRLIKKMVD